MEGPTLIVKRRSFHIGSQFPHKQSFLFFSFSLFFFHNFVDCWLANKRLIKKLLLYSLSSFSSANPSHLSFLSFIPFLCPLHWCRMGGRLYFINGNIVSHMGPVFTVSIQSRRLSRQEQQKRLTRFNVDLIYPTWLTWTARSTTLHVSHVDQ